MKRLLAILLATVIFVGTFPVNTYAVSENAGNGTSAGEEKINDADVINVYEQEITTGTQESAKANETDIDEDIKDEVESLVDSEWITIRISSAEDIIKLSKDCRLDTWSRNKCIELTDDISLAESDFVTIPTFGGIFDGQNHTISGFNIDGEESNMGLFSYVQPDGVIKNLNVEGKIRPIEKSSVIGAIAGRNDGVIVNCDFNGIVSGNDYVGGIAGINGLSGVISDSMSHGLIMGSHFTGGICGENMGNILRCCNEAYVNTSEQKKTSSIENMDITFYKEIFRGDEGSSTSMSERVVDTGGIAGVSIGIIQHSSNKARVGYDKLGYNVGGIAGRQSGYILDCTNEGEIKGRKDIGGIAGQAEPYVTVDFTQDIAYQLSDNISKLHDIISVTLRDADDKSDVISNRLSIIQSFTDSAIDDTRYLADNGVGWVDGMVDGANEVVSRVDYIMDESAKRDGMIDELNRATSNSRDAARKLSDTINDLDIYRYMSDEDQLEYDHARTSLEEAMEEYAGYEDEGYKSYYNYYIDSIRYDDEYSQIGEANENDLTYKHKKDDGTYEYLFQKESSSPSYDKDKYNIEGEWIHKENPSVEDSNEKRFPDGSDEDQLDLDNELIEEASAEAARKATIYANTEYEDNHPGHTYANDMEDYARTMTLMINKYSDTMTEEAQNDAQDAVEYISKATDNISAAGSETKRMIDNVNGRSDIVLPKLGDEYRNHTTSLNNSLQGMSENFGILNTEMNSASDALLDDLGAVNDQFDKIMQLYTDALDGVLDMDYSNIVEDNSYEVAENCTDATIALSTNTGAVSGSLNVSGIAGTMAIEYDYDLESDVTGIKEGGYNTTYITKCVIRGCKNNENVESGKDNSGGICGLQEMGTIIDCENYGKVVSDSGSYVGGIAGSSMSHIVNSYEKGLLKGKSYVGGIAGKGCHVLNSLSMPVVEDAVNYYGAVAGDITSDGVVRNNYFVSDVLAGVDRISYSKKAEPILYNEIANLEEVPKEFSNITITFVMDDEDDSLDAQNEVMIGRKTVPYGGNVLAADYPEVDEKEGYYVAWDKPCVENVGEDTEIHVSYERVVTTISSDHKYNGCQSSILVDGNFTQDDVLEANMNPTASDRRDDAFEYWEIEIPDDSLNSHVLRYNTDEAEEYDVYFLDNGDWIKTEPIDSLGRYRLFYTKGNHIRMQIVGRDKNIDYKLIIIVASTFVFVIIAVIVTIRLVGKKNRKKEKKNKGKNNEERGDVNRGEKVHE